MSPAVQGVMMPAWAMTVIAGIIIALIALAWNDLKNRVEALGKRLEGHIDQDVRAHERLSILETKVEANTFNIAENYNKFHRFQVEMREGAKENYKWLVEEFAKLYRWITEKLVGENPK